MKKRRWKDQPCWNCKKCFGGCSWSRAFIPVKGWDAEKTKIHNDLHYIDSYKIYSCPEYVEEKKNV